MRLKLQSEPTGEEKQGKQRGGFGLGQRQPAVRGENLTNRRRAGGPWSSGRPARAPLENGGPACDRS